MHGTDPADLAGSLRGVRVISMAEQYPGPLCTMLLVDLGAEVILIERPDGGDPQRNANPWLFRSTGADKVSVTLDLKDADDRAAAHALVASAEVFVEGFRPGVAARLGMGFEELSALNPRLIYCSISGYGQDGPYRDLSGHNINYEAVSGLLDRVADDASAQRHDASGVPFGDVTSGLMAALGIVAGLRSVEQSGMPVRLDVSMTDALVLSLGPQATRALNGDRPWSTREPAYGLFPCADGTLALGISYEDHFWQSLCRHLRLPDLESLRRTERLRDARALRERVAVVLAGESVQHWLDALGAEVPCSRARRLVDLEGDPQLAHRGVFAEATDEDGQAFLTVASPFGRHHPDRSRRVPALGSTAVEEVAR